MSNNLGRTEVSPSQTQKETAINNSDGILDAAITSELTLSWSGDTLKVLTTAQLRQNQTFIMTGSPGASPVLKMAAVQRGVVMVDNDLGVDLTVTDNSAAEEVVVKSGQLAAVYVTATGVRRVFESDSVVLPGDVSITARVSSTANVVIATALNNGDVLNGVTLATNDVVLLKDQTTASENGLYVVDAVPYRATNFDDGGTEVYAGALITVTEGSTNADTLWMLTTNNPITVGSTALTFKKLNASSTAYATNSQVLAGTATSKAVDPAKLASLWVKGSDIASASTITIGNGRYFHVTGTTPITDIDWSNATNGREAVLVFDGVLTLTHNATTLVLPGGADITTAAGDRAAFIQDNADNVYCVWYQRANGTALISSSGLTASTTTETLQGVDATVFVTPDSLYALWGKGSAVASASTVSFDEGGYFHITGTSTIVDIDWATAKNGRWAIVVFDGALTITYNATTLKLPGAADIITAAGDTACFIQDASDNVICVWYQRADGSPLTSASFAAASTTQVLTGTNATRGVTPDSLAALWEKGANVASASVVTLGEGGLFHITGTTTITDIDWSVPKDGRWAWLIFDGVLTLTHNATTLVLPGGANINTAAGDMAYVTQDSSDNVYVRYFRANGKAVVPSSQVIAIAVSDETTALTTGTAKATFRMPFAFTLTDIRASVTTAPTGGTLLTVDVNESGSSIISTKLTFDASEKTTTTAATPRVISDSSLADDAEITIDIDAVGSTIAGAGLKVYLIGYPT